MDPGTNDRRGRLKKIFHFLRGKGKYCVRGKKN